MKATAFIVWFFTSKEHKEIDKDKHYSFINKSPCQQSAYVLAGFLINIEFLKDIVTFYNKMQNYLLKYYFCFVC